MLPVRATSIRAAIWHTLAFATHIFIFALNVGTQVDAFAVSACFIALAIDELAWRSTIANIAHQSIEAFVILAPRSTYALDTLLVPRARGILVNGTIAVIIDAITRLGQGRATHTTPVAKPVVDNTIAVVV